MAEIASAWVSLLPSAKGFGRKLEADVGGQVEGSGKKLGSRFGKVFAVAGGAIAAAGVGSMMKSVVSEASEAQQSLGATESIFKRFSGSIIANSKGAAQEFGLSANQYRESANLIGSLFKNQGVSMDKLAGQTDTMIGRAADLSAMFGGTTAEAVESLGSAFKGEFNPLEKYGITLNQTAINAELAARGQDKLEGSALSAAKQAATMDLIMRQSKDSMGTFGKESNTLAGQQQRLGAQWSDMKSKLGTQLLPALTSVASKINAAVLPGITSFATGMKNGTGAGGRFAAVLLTIKDALAGTVGFLNQHRTAAAALLGTVAALVVVTKVHAAVLAVQSAGGMAKFAATMFKASAIGKAFAAVQWLVNAALTANPIGIVVVAIAALVTGLVIAYKKSDTFRKIVNKAFDGVKKVVGSVVGWFGKYVPQVFSKVVGAVKGYINIYRTVITTAFNVVKSVVGSVGAFIAGSVKFFAKLASGVRSKIGEVVGFVKALPGRIKAVFTGAGSVLLSAGKDIIQGLLDGIGAMVGKVKDKLNEVTDLIPDWKGPAKKDRKLLRNAGRLIMRGLVDGIRDGESGLEQRLGRVTKAIERALDNGDITKKAARRMSRTVDAVDKQLGRLAKRYDRHTKKLNSLYDARKSMTDSIGSSIAGELDLGSLVTTSEPNEFGFGGGQTNVTFASVSSAVRGLASRAYTFTKKLYALRKAGIPMGLIQEVASLGSTQGIAVANALLSGSRAQVRDLSANYGLIQRNSTAAGYAVAAGFYNAGIQGQKGIIRGLLKDDTLKKASRTLARRLTKHVRRALGIKSPSRVMASQVGEPMAAGVAAGFDNGQMNAARSIQATTNRLVPSLVPLGANDIHTSEVARDPASMLDKMTINVTLGTSSRTKAQLYLDGKLAAERLI